MGTKTKSAPRSKLIGAIVFALSVAVLIGFFGLIDAKRYIDEPVIGEGEERQFTIPEGTNWPKTMDILVNEGVITKRHWFEVWARRRGLPSRVKAGHYALSGPLSFEELEQALLKGGRADETIVTILEGWSIFHIADRLEGINLVSRRAFLDAARSPELLAELEIPADSFEGYLFPDTYRFSRTTGAEAIIRRMNARFEEVYQTLLKEYPPSKDVKDFSKHQIVTLASLIEKETRANHERPLISRVFLNRLDLKMRLQTDPTCVYGEETYREVPHPRYCRDRLNRYSTYVIDGLPPGPIANPGKASLKASLQPDSTQDSKAYLFFVAKRDGSGAHHFTKTYDEHKKLVKKYLK